MTTISQRSLSARYLLPAAFVLALASSAGAATPIDERIAAGAAGTVRIENVSGSVAVTGTDAAEVRVTGTLGDGVKELRVEARGDVVEIEVVLPRRAKDVEDTDLVVEVPRGSNLDISTVSASIDVSGVEGAHDLESVSGNVALEAAARSLDAETVSGRIRAEGVAGEFEGSSVSGAIEIVNCRVERATAETVSGSVTFDSDLEQDASVAIESTSGSVRVKLSERADASVAIETFSGSIANEFDAEVIEPKIGPGRSCEFEIGGGGSEVRIKNFSGGVSVGKRIARS